MPMQMSNKYIRCIRAILTIIARDIAHTMEFDYYEGLMQMPIDGFE